jgi:transcriptional regulator with XRE-family HTH domain
MSSAILIFDEGGISSRIAEARKLRGLTQGGLAVKVPCSKSLVSQVERGVTPATPWFVAAVARALNIDLSELLGQPYRGTTERTDRVHASIPQIRIALNYWNVPSDPDFAPRPADKIHQDVEVIGRLLDKVDYIELGARLPGLIEELSAVFHGSAGTARQDAAELLMYTFIAAKSVAYRLGYIDLVSVALDRAVQAARETDKPELAAFIAEEHSQVFFSTGAYHVGLKFMAQAHRDYDDLTCTSEPGLAVAGSMYLRSAIMAARDPEHRADAWGYLAEAREVGERIGRDTNHYGLIFGPSNVSIHGVATAIELVDADKAVRLSEGFSPPADLPVERSSHHYIDVARARLSAGQPARALSALEKADRLAPQHTRNHPMARETVAALIRQRYTLPESLRSMASRMGVTPTRTGANLGRARAQVLYGRRGIPLCHAMTGVPVSRW